MKKKHLSFSKWVLCFALTAGLGLSSCSDDDTKYDDQINDINKELASLKSAIEKIQQSYVSGIAKSADGANLVFTLSDGTTQTVAIKGEKGDTGAAGSNGTASVVTIGANGNWFVDGVDTGKSSKGTASVVTIGANGNWFIDGVDTGKTSRPTNGTGTTTGSSVTVVEKDTYFLMTVTDAAGKATEYKLPKATKLVTSLEFVPTTVNDKDVKIIAFPYIFQDFYRNVGRNTSGNAIENFLYNNTWSTAGIQSTETGVPYQTLALKYAQDALVKYRVNPASVDKAAFKIKGFSLESAQIVRAFTASNALSISDSTYTTANGQTLLSLKVKAVNLPNPNGVDNNVAGNTGKTDMVSLVVENTNATLTAGQEASLVYSEYIPAKQVNYVADLVKTLPTNKAVAANRANYEGGTNYGYIPTRHYQILHPKMTDAQVNVYRPFTEVPALTDTNAATVIAALVKVRNFTLMYDNSKALVLSDSLDGIFDTESNAKSTAWMSDNFFKANKFDYDWNFEPVKFQKDDVNNNTADKYMTLNATTGKVSVKDPNDVIEGHESDKNYAAINRMLVVRANLLKKGTKEVLLSRIVLIHVVGEAEAVETEIRIPNQTVLVPGCDETGRLDMDKIFNHNTVQMDKATFNKNYTIFNGVAINGTTEVTADPTKTKITYIDPTTKTLVTTNASLLGVTVVDARVADNVVKISNVQGLLPGVTYNIYGTYQGTGMKDVNVVWEFTVIRPTLPAVTKNTLTDYWRDGNVQATGTDSRILNSKKAWDEVVMLKNAFEKYGETYKLQKLVNGVQVDGDCGSKVMELAFILLDPTTFQPYSSTNPGATANANWINRRYAHYFITHFVGQAGTQTVTLLPSNTSPNASVLANGTVQFSFTNLELFYNFDGRSYVGYNRYTNISVANKDTSKTIDARGVQANLVPVQAVVYLDRDYSFYYPINFNTGTGLDKTIAAKFYTDFHNPVQPIVGKNGEAVKGGVYLVDRTPEHQADLGRLFAIQNEANKFIYNYGAVLNTGGTVDAVADQSRWNQDLVAQYKVGYNLSSDLGTTGLDLNSTFENNNSRYINPAITAHLYRAKYEVLGILDDNNVLKELPGTVKCEIDQKTGLVTWDMPGEDLQKMRMIRFSITVPNQWNWGEFNGTGSYYNAVTGKTVATTNKFNTAKYITTYVDVPLVPQSQDPDPGK